MKNILFIVFLFIASNITDTTFLKKDYVCWEVEKPLKWKYFKGRVPKNARKQVAITKIKINYFIISRNSIRINNCFVKNESWVKNSYRQSEILRHEQYHFNLAEVYVRKMRKAMQNIDTLNITNVQLVFDNWFKKLEIAQKQYDKETAHSNNKEEQIKWENKIDGLLLNLSDFKSQIITITAATKRKPTKAPKKPKASE